MIGPFQIRGEEIVPDYLGPPDRIWLREVLEEYARFVGQPRRILHQRWGEPFSCPAPAGKRKLIFALLDRAGTARPSTGLSPRAVRRTLFAARAAREGDSAVILAEVAASLAIATAELPGLLFADLPRERPVGPLAVECSASLLIPQANLELVQGLLKRSLHLQVRLGRQAHAVVRAARYRGLICTVRRPSGRRIMTPPVGGDETMLEISGPLSVIRRTTLYGRALASLLPLLSWAGPFHLRARCLIDGRPLRFELKSGEALLPGREPQKFDSGVEARFARDFSRLAPDWEILREDEVIEVAGHLFFPDFTLRHRWDATRSWRLEIVGFWTAEYVAKKLARLRAANLRNLILCLDADRACDSGGMAHPDLPATTVVLRYRRRIDAAAVLAVIEGRAAERC